MTEETHGLAINCLELQGHSSPAASAMPESSPRSDVEVTFPLPVQRGVPYQMSLSLPQNLEAMITPITGTITEFRAM